MSTAEAVRAHHAGMNRRFDPQLPDAVVFAHSVEDVQTVVRLCARITCRSCPTATVRLSKVICSQCKVAVSLDLSGMNRVLSVNAEDLTATVEAGVSRKQLNETLRDTGLFFPVDPGADASIGGMTATRASGTNAVRYGTMRENVLGLSVVRADGCLIKDRHAGAQVRGGIRFDASVHRLGRHAGRDRRHHRAALSATRGDRGGRVHVCVDGARRCAPSSKRSS